VTWKTQRTLQVGLRINYIVGCCLRVRTCYNSHPTVRNVNGFLPGLWLGNCQISCRSSNSWSDSWTQRQTM